DSAQRLPAVTRPLADCAGRALREEQRAPHPLPPFRNSAMDGWAVRSADLVAAAAGRPVRLQRAPTLAAGATAAEPLAPGRTARIMTGAPLPEGADAVVPIEEGPDDAGELDFARPVAPGRHVRKAGADLAAG